MTPQRESHREWVVGRDRITIRFTPPVQRSVDCKEHQPHTRNVEVRWGATT